MRKCAVTSGKRKEGTHERKESQEDSTECPKKSDECCAGNSNAVYDGCGIHTSGNIQGQ